MNNYIRFLVASFVGILIGMYLYRLFVSMRLQLSANIGAALIGASMGALGGIILVTAYGLDHVSFFYWGGPCLIAIIGAMGFQKSFENWTR